MHKLQQQVVSQRGEMSKPVTVPDQANIQLHVLIFRDTDLDVWIAQGLEYDICAQADTLDEAPAEFERILAATALVSIEMGREPFEGIDRAPQEFWDNFERASFQSELDMSHPLWHSEARPMPTFTPRFRLVEKLTA